MIKAIQVFNRIKNQFFETINKTDKPLAKSTKKRDIELMRLEMKRESEWLVFANLSQT